MLFSVPRTELIGNADRYVKAGSAVHLQCIIFGAIEPTTYIMWYHDAHPILADNKLGYKMHLIKGNGNQNGANRYDNNDLVPSPFDSLFRHQHSVSFFLNTIFTSFIEYFLNDLYSRLDLYSSNQQINFILGITHAIHPIVFRPQSVYMYSVVNINFLKVFRD